MSQLSEPTVNYIQYSNRQLVAVPLALLAVALLVISGWYLLTGTPANLGLEFVSTGAVIGSTGVFSISVSS